MDERMLFVIGAPRSGTTLLTAMLRGHPDVHAPAEPHLLTPLAHVGYHAHVEKAPYDPYRTALAVRAFVDDLPRGEADYLDALRACTDTLYGRMLAANGKRVFVDKTPANALVLPFVAKLYPRARYVVLTRHPFAVFASFARSFFDDDWRAAHAFHPILERYVPAIAAFLRDGPVSFHVAYEDLVADPEAALNRLCDRCALAFRPELVVYGGRGLPARFGDPWIARHDRPHTGSVDRWVAEVAGRPDRVDLLERMVARITDDDLAAWGYDRASLWAPLRRVAPERVPRGRRFDRFRLERRLLLRLRRNLDRHGLDAAVRKVRFYCDLLLREQADV